MSSLCEAAKIGNLKAVKCEIEAGTSIDFRLDNGQSALFLAAEYGHKDIVEYLLDENACLLFPIKSKLKIMENWEVFTQVFRSCYPNGISRIDVNRISIGKMFVEQSIKIHRPLLYEALYCSLTLLYNPISIYCVGLYSLVSPEVATQGFREDTFLSTLCTSFDESNFYDFLNTVYIILSVSKSQLKKVSGIVAKSCCWGSILQNLIESTNEACKNTCRNVLLPLTRIFNFLLSNISVKTTVVTQLEGLSTDHFYKLGRLLYLYLFTSQSNHLDDEDEILNKPIWLFLLSLIKHFLKSDKRYHASRIMLQKNEDEKHQDNTSSNYMKHIVCKALEEDVELVHLLLDFHFPFEGSNFVKAIKLGCIDVLERLKDDRSLLFSSETENFLLVPSNLKFSSNRNMKLCIKVLKRGRKKHSQEQLQSLQDEEDIITEPFFYKTSSLQDLVGSSDKKINTETKASFFQIEKLNKENEKQQKSQSDDEKNIQECQKRHKSSKKKKKPKKKKRSRCQSESSAPLYAPVDVEKDFNGSLHLLGTSSRRRRISSSSSECSIDGSRKSVSFSHPLSQSKSIDEVEAEISSGKVIPSHPTPSRSCLRILDEDLQGDDDVTHESRWTARFEDMMSMNDQNLKKICLNPEDEEKNRIRFSLEQHHLLIGHGEMSSSVYLGLDDFNSEFSVKKFNIRNADLLNNPQTVEMLRSLRPHPSILQNFYIFKDKPNFYQISELAEFSLTQVFVSHSIFHLPSTTTTHFKQLVEGLQHLHQNNILHRSIRPSNVLIGRDGIMKLADYGIHSSSFFQTSNTSTFIQCWLSSEILKYKHKREDYFSEKSDISCLGMLFYYILTEGGHPFGDPSSSAEICIANIQRGSYNLKILSSDPFSHHLVQNMLFKEPEKRFNLNQVASHPYFIERSDRSERLEKVLKKYSSYRTYVGDLLEAHSREILSLYSDRSNLYHLKEEITTVQDLFLIIQKSLDDYDFFLQITLEKRNADETVLEFFTRSFPGLVLSAFDLLNSLGDTEPSKDTQKITHIINNKQLLEEKEFDKSLPATSYKAGYITGKSCQLTDAKYPNANESITDDHKIMSHNNLFNKLSISHKQALEIKFDVNHCWLTSCLLLQNNIQLFGNQNTEVLIFLDKNHFLNEMFPNNPFISMSLPYTNMDELD